MVVQTHGLIILKYKYFGLVFKFLLQVCGYQQYGNNMNVPKSLFVISLKEIVAY